MLCNICILMVKRQLQIEMEHKTTEVGGLRKELMQLTERLRQTESSDESMREVTYNYCIVAKGHGLVAAIDYHV